MQINNPLFAPDDGGGSSGSLVDPNNLPADDPVSDNSGQQTPSADEAANQKADPFGDLNTFKDPDNGLYLGKYKNVLEVFNGYKELTNKLREKTPEAPETAEAYKIEFAADSEFGEYKLNMEDPMWKQMAPVFKDANVSNEMAQKLVEGFLKYQIASKPDIAAEKAKLGDEAPKIINEVGVYLKKRSSPAMNTLAELAGQSAETLKELHLLIKQGGEKNIPSKLDGNEPFKSHEELMADALAYKTKHQKEMDNGNTHHQQAYYALLTKAQALKKTS
jgi:hypothetical protein